MARSLTNNLAVRVAIESTIGVLPGTPLWVLMEPNSLGSYGAEITTVPRNPISNTRQGRKGSVTDLDSSVEWEGDLTKHHCLEFIEGFIFATRANPTVIERIQAGADYENLAATASDTFTHDAITTALPAGTLVKARGFTNAANNGLFEVDTLSTTTVTELANTPGTVAETPATTTGARIDVAGFRFTDLTWTDASNDIGSAGIDLTTLGLTVGQMVRVGGDNSFAGGDISGRITAITAATITLDKVRNLGTGTLDGGGDVGASTVDLLYGQFVRNVATDDGDFLERSYTFEVAYKDLGGIGTDEYEYAKGNLCNELTLNLPGQDKSTVNFGFVGTDSDKLTQSRKTNTANTVEPVQTTAFNTASGLAQLNLTGATDLGTCFKSVTLTLGNEVSPEKCLGTLGATFMNTGNFSVTMDAELLFTDSALTDAIRDNETVTFDVIMDNDDGALAFDIPSMTLGGGGRGFPVNESITISTEGSAFQDPTLSTSLSFSEFPHWPTVS
jgi:hypothetical protein